LYPEKNGYEVRAYEPYVVATVEVGGNQNQALNKGFTVLADYIFGNNTSKQKLAMTTPVKEAASEKIAMTAPVLEQAGNTTAPHEISFVMPVTSTLETLPKPNNPAVKLRQIPARKVAVLKYTWLTPESRVENKKKQLQELLKKDGVTTLGTPEAADIFLFSALNVISPVVTVNAVVCNAPTNVNAPAPVNVAAKVAPPYQRNPLDVVAELNHI
jgi:hypothetical protein